MKFFKFSRDRFMAWYGNNKYNRYGYNRYGYNRYGYRKNRSFIDMFDERNDYADEEEETKYPIYKIVCENEAYFGFINAIPNYCGPNNQFYLKYNFLQI